MTGKKGKNNSIIKGGRRAHRDLIRGLVAGLTLFVAIWGFTHGPLGIQSTNAAGMGQGKSKKPVAVFDYQMPARYGLDSDGDGIIDPHASVEQIQPEYWTVILDACESLPGDKHAGNVRGQPDEIVNYRWEIRQKRGPRIFKGSTPDCLFTFKYLPAEGVYDVRLRVSDSNNKHGKARMDVVIQDWLIGGLGDSYSSGEGNPDIPGNLVRPAQWQDAVCARSANSLQAQFALLLEEIDPRTSVTFVHPACSGAKITTGELQDQVKSIDPPIAVPPQIEYLSYLVGGREIDLMLNGIGGNDVFFVDIVGGCMFMDNCWLDREQVDPEPALIELVQNALCADLSPVETALCRQASEAVIARFLLNVFPESPGQLFARGRDGLPQDQCFHYDPDDSMNNGPCGDLLPGTEEGDQCQLMQCTGLGEKYALVKEALDVFLPYFDQSRQVTYPYPNFTERYNEMGELVLCEPVPGDPSASLPGVSKAEWEWAREVLLGDREPPQDALENDDHLDDPGLNWEMRQASEAYGWRYLGELRALYEGFGYCADKGTYRIHHLADVLPVPGGNAGGPAGFVHPNTPGLTSYCSGLANALLGDLYPGAELPEYDCSEDDHQMIDAVARMPHH